MRIPRALAVSLVAASLLGGGIALAQQTASPVCEAHEKARGNAPKQVEGRVLRVDTAASRVTVQETDGKVHEFQASKEALQIVKVGDSIMASLRPVC